MIRTLYTVRNKKRRTNRNLWKWPFLFYGSTTLSSLQNRVPNSIKPVFSKYLLDMNSKFSSKALTLNSYKQNFKHKVRLKKKKMYIFTNYIRGPSNSNSPHNKSRLKLTGRKTKCLFSFLRASIKYTNLIRFTSTKSTLTLIV